jgi:NAD dependent epimerase/dehydratase family enzyme
VVNLAGAPIADRPWTAGRRNLLWASRITLTEQLLAWLRAASNARGADFRLCGGLVR